MSTKVTISCDPGVDTTLMTSDFHLYYDYADNKIHLDVQAEEVEFRAWPNGYHVVIPIDVMKTLVEDLSSNRKNGFKYPWELEE